MRWMYWKSGFVILISNHRYLTFYLLTYKYLLVCEVSIINY